MKKTLFLLLFFLSGSYLSQSQVPGIPPQGISYQAVAYNPTTHIPLVSQAISLKFSILDTSATGSVVYSETFTLNTDAQGVFSLNIGAGTPAPGYNFSNINWAINQKFLKVEMDPAGGSSYVIVGTNQLMSVPYALYSGNTASLNMKTVDTIDELRSSDNIHLKENLVYVKGYWYPGDSGGGFFSFEPEDNQPDNEGTIIKPNSIPDSENGRWIRQYNGYINARFFGVVRDWENPYSGFSNSAQIQKAIDFATKYSFGSPSPNSGMTIFFPSGTYYIDQKIILKDKVNLLGESGTFFVDHNGDYPYMFELDNAQVNHFKMDNFVINPNNKDGVGAFHIKGAKKDMPGGLWLSTFKNIYIFNLMGNGIYLEGGDSDSSDYFNQFLTFENVRAIRSADNYNSLKMTGQNGQVTFLNCTFDGVRNKGTNVNITINGDKGLWSAVVSFVNCTFQDSEYGINLKNAENITIDNCWFENLDLAVQIENSNAISIVGSRFANAAGFGSIAGSLFPPETGRCINVKDSSVNIERNYVTVGNVYSSLVKNEKFVIGTGYNNSINLKDNQFKDMYLSQTAGVYQVTTIDSNELTLLGKKLVFVTVLPDSTPIDNQINKINSTLGAGETIFIRANSGSIKFNAMTSLNHGNIFLNGNIALTLVNGQAATFIKIDNEFYSQKCTYQLYSISN